MDKHTKDDINFHGFLKAKKKMQKVSNETLGKGIYTTNLMGRIVRGERLPKKLERDRIVARLGVASEDYEDYLSREEYADWLVRQEILKCIEEKDIENLADLLDQFEAGDLDKVEKQFLETMRFMMLKMKNASEEELCTVIERAVAYTIPIIDEGFPKKLLLADQEINLLIEYVNLHHHGETETEEQKWRYDRYMDIFNYIEQSRIDNIGKAKIYPKLVFFICQEYKDGKGSLEDIRRCLEWCNEAVELLRNTRKLYYFVELLEMRQWLIARILDTKAAVEIEAVQELQEVAATSKEWAEVLINLYREYDVCPYMEDFGYLYLETESHCINAIIRIRRKMLNLTQREVAEDACDEKTVRRTEKYQMSPQMYAVRGMFKNLGLCPEYVRERVISTDIEALKLRRKLSKYSNERNAELWKTTLEELEKSVSMEIIQNKQVIERSRILLNECMGELSETETVESLKKVLEYTVPIDGIMKVDEWYLTVEEISCLHNIAGYVGAVENNSYITILKEYCDREIEQRRIERRLGTFDLIVAGVADYLGNMGRSEESTELGEILIKVNLKNRRMRTLARNLYNNCWNKYNIEDGNALARDKKEVKETLKLCILLSKITKNNSLTNFLIMMSER